MSRSWYSNYRRITPRYAKWMARKKESPESKIKLLRRELG